MIVAGCDIGNSTTEVAVARIVPGRAPEWLGVWRQPTSGRKGTAASSAGVVMLLDLAERRIGAPIDQIVRAELRPVDSELRELGRVERIDLARNAVARPASDTPSGLGAAAGTLRRVADLAGEPERGSVLAIVCDEEFHDAASRLVSARERGWTIAGVIVRGDDAVLIGNRFDRAIPIVDEVTDAGELPLGAHAALEVAEAGERVERLADPLALAELLELPLDEARAARAAARAVAGRRAALVVRAERAPVEPIDAVAELEIAWADGSRTRFDETAEVPFPGAIAGIGERARLRDAFWASLPASSEQTAFQRVLVERRLTALALLADHPDDPVGTTLGARSFEPICSESSAALLGAATTPRAGTTPIVLDLGGGTVDLHRAGMTEGRAVACAGAGELVTRICAGVLGVGTEAAERAKRSSSARVETPFVLLHEDGTRSFRAEPAPPETLARLCTQRAETLEPIATHLSPESWGRLRREAKRSVIGVNVRRALAATGGAEPGELVTLVGGSACDREIVAIVDDALRDLDLAVARGNVLGAHGPRAAVAVGLVLAFAGAR